jgi:hypothetical protein
MVLLWKARKHKVTNEDLYAMCGCLPASVHASNHAVRDEASWSLMEAFQPCPYSVH